MADERAWWETLTRIGFDDLEQEAPIYRVRNHVRVPLPYLGICSPISAPWEKASAGAFSPAGSRSFLRCSTDSTRSASISWISFPVTVANCSQFDPDRPGFASYARLAKQLNHSINAFRPRLKAMARQVRGCRYEG